MELVEAQRARVRANCWRQTWAHVSRRFTEVTGQALKAGMQVLVEVSVEIHPQYGMSLTVYDIDPTFSLGDIARRRQEDIRRLTEAGLTERQQQLSLATLPKRIAVISSASAAGYQDFVHQLTNNSAGYAFSLSLFEAVMQGDSAAASISDALARLRQTLSSFDTVVIIRGGGATSDLSCFDDYTLAALCAVFPLPILTGIGHTRDVSLVDMVAFRALKTPTAVAEFLIGCLDNQSSLLNDLQLRLTHTAVTRATQRRTVVDHLAARLQTTFTMRFKHERMILDMWEKSVANQSPERILRKGYAVVMRDGKVLRQCSDVATNDLLTIEWHDGTITAVATK